jgi:GAF domain-containing protein
MCEGENVSGKVWRTGQPARMDSYERAPGSIAARMRDLGIRSRVGAPIIVDDRVWGLAVVGSRRPEPLPPDTEERVGEFADLVATAIAAATSRAELIESRRRIVAAADDTRRRLERNRTTVFSSARSGWGCSCARPKTWSQASSARSETCFP